MVKPITIPANCPQCGAPIKNDICPSCGWNPRAAAQGKTEADYAALARKNELREAVGLPPLTGDEPEQPKAAVADPGAAAAPAPGADDSAAPAPGVGSIPTTSGW